MLMFTSLLCRVTYAFGLFEATWATFKALALANARPARREGRVLHAPEAVLRFWIVLAVYALYASYFEVFVGWLPLYSEAKLVLLVAVVWPGSTAYSRVFDRLVAPAVQATEHAALSRVVPRARLVGSSLLRYCYSHGVGFLTWAAFPDELERWAAVLKEQRRLVDAELGDRQLAGTAGDGAAPTEAATGRSGDVWANFVAEVEVPEAALFGGGAGSPEPATAESAAVPEPVLWGDDSSGGRAVDGQHPGGQDAESPRELSGETDADAPRTPPSVNVALRRRRARVA